MVIREMLNRAEQYEFDVDAHLVWVCVVPLNPDVVPKARRRRTATTSMLLRAWLDVVEGGASIEITRWCHRCQSADHGKVSVANTTTVKSVSVSHTEDAVVLAGSTAPALGIDAEDGESAPHAFEARDAFMSPDELAMCTDPEKALSAWTAKEAYVKCFDRPEETKLSDVILQKAPVVRGPSGLGVLKTVQLSSKKSRLLVSAVVPKIGKSQC